MSSFWANIKGKGRGNTGSVNEASVVGNTYTPTPVPNLKTIESGTSNPHSRDSLKLLRISPPTKRLIPIPINVQSHENLLMNEETEPSSGNEETNIYEGSINPRRQIGLTSSIFLIFNRMIGTGIFATPSTILLLSGSIGLSLLLWVAGAIIAAAGMLTYMEFGTGLPQNGGEKNYLEYVFRRPKFLVTAAYAMYVVLLGWAGSNSVVFGEYILSAAKVEVGRWNQ